MQVGRAWLVLWLAYTGSVFALKIDRVILAVDSHPNYINFWPMIARAWQDNIGIRPTLALIADPEVKIDESLGDVIRFTPIEGIPTWFHAQTIRLLLPTMFPDEVCITADMDMLPISKSYFVDSVKEVQSDKFIVYNDAAYKGRFPICYLAAKGDLFREILRFSKDDKIDFEDVIKQWFDYGLGWETDERVFYRYMETWSGFQDRCVKLGYGKETGRRICRSNWKYNKSKLNNHYYDAHLPRPYSENKNKVDDLVISLGVKI